MEILLITGPLDPTVCSLIVVMRGWFRADPSCMSGWADWDCFLKARGLERGSGEASYGVWISCTLMWVMEIITLIWVSGKVKKRPRKMQWVTRIGRTCLIYMVLQYHPGLGKCKRKNSLLMGFKYVLCIKGRITAFLQVSGQLRC